MSGLIGQIDARSGFIRSSTSDSITIAGASTALGGSITANTIIDAVTSGELVTSGMINMASGNISMAIGASATVPTFTLGDAHRIYLFITANAAGDQGGMLTLTTSASTLADQGTQIWNRYTTITHANSSGTITFTVQNNNGGVGTYHYKWTLIRLK